MNAGQNGMSERDDKEGESDGERRPKKDNKATPAVVCKLHEAATQKTKNPSKFVPKKQKQISFRWKGGSGG